jgi:broad specificity phosphatase PhoE
VSGASAADAGAGAEAAVEAPAAELVLVRHAETDWSRAGRHTGRTDVPLSAAGRAAAAALRARLVDWRFELVLVSPLARARETCELTGLSARAEPRGDLQEWDYGDYEGLTTAEIKARRADWSLWRDGCPGGETAADVGLRADRVLAELRSVHGPVAVFSHGHMLRVLGARWIALGADQGAHLGLSTGALCLLSRERGYSILARWNDTGAGTFTSDRATAAR